jgi:hypothetical protein
MLSIQAILLTSSLVLIAAMLGSLAWLSVVRRPTETVQVEPGPDRI